MLFWCFFAFLPFSVRPIVYTTIFFSWWCLCVWLHAIREGENEKLKVKQIRHACMQHCVHGRKIALGPRNEFSSNPRFLLFVIFYIFVEVVGAPKSSLFAFKSIQFILFFYWKSRSSWNYCRTVARAILLCRKITHGCI